MVDGHTGWIGGHNVGDEYLGLSPRRGPWRDTHVKITGPAVLGMQKSFFDDWRWATGEKLELDWLAQPSLAGDVPTLILASGPADPQETASLMFQDVIHSARRRLWITSPYFVPDPAVIGALHLAALRGVEVRILIPNDPDHLLVYLSAFAFVGEMIDCRHPDLPLPGGLPPPEGLPDRRRDLRRRHRQPRQPLLPPQLRDHGDLRRPRRRVAGGADARGGLRAGAADDAARELRRKPFWFKAAARAASLAAPIQ